MCDSLLPPLPPPVITELDGLAKGQDSFGGGGGGGGGGGSNHGNSGHARAVQEKARQAVAFLERGFEAREPGLRALTSRGNQLESIAFRSEDTSGQQVRRGRSRGGASRQARLVGSHVNLCFLFRHRVTTMMSSCPAVSTTAKTRRRTSCQRPEVSSSSVYHPMLMLGSLIFECV